MAKTKEMTLAQRFDEIRWKHEPDDINDVEHVQQCFEKVYDEVVPVMKEYRDGLAKDDPLAIYLNYFLRPAIAIFNDESEEPELYATIPLLGHDEVPITSMGNVKDIFNSYTTVRIVACSELGDVGITRNLDAPRGFETRVFWDSLTRYRAKP